MVPDDERMDIKMRTNLNSRNKKRRLPKCYIGIDNGISGTIGILRGDKSSFFKVPTFFGQDYVKTKKNVTRIDFISLASLLDKIVASSLETFIIMERPMINPRRFSATVSAARSMESVLIVVDLLKARHKIHFRWVDSKEWQSRIFPKGTKGDKTKLRSMQIGSKKYPQHSELIVKHKDADGLMLAEFCRNEYQ